MSRLTPLILLVAVTALLLAYGSTHWSWVGGPLAALVPWALGRKAQEPSAPAAAHANVRREPAPVD